MSLVVPGLFSFHFFFLPLCCAAAEVKPWEPPRSAVGTWTRVRIAADAIRFMTCETLHLVVMEAKCEVVYILVARSGSGGPDNLWTRRPARRSEASGREGGRLGGARMIITAEC